MLNICRSSYYDWLQNPIGIRKKEDIKLKQKIVKIFVDNRNVYGIRRVQKVLQKDDIVVSQRRISRLMKEEGLSCKTKKKFKATTDSKHNNSISPNLLKRQFNVCRANQYWVGDITYIHTAQGWLYLAVVIDLYSRQGVGWSMSKNIDAKLVNEALLMAIWKRKPKKGLIWHTDRGSQYASNSHRQILADHGIKQSMSQKGNCWDNAVAESFFHTLKTEATEHYKFKNQEEAKNVILEYIEVFYNRKRLHSSNGYLSPVQFEQVNHI